SLRAIAGIEEFAHRQHLTLEHGLRPIAGKTHKVEVRLPGCRGPQPLEGTVEQFGLPLPCLGGLGRRPRGGRRRVASAKPGEAEAGAKPEEAEAAAKQTSQARVPAMTRARPRHPIRHTLPHTVPHALSLMPKDRPST